jgi:hypothetical protein
VPPPTISNVLEVASFPWKDTAGACAYASTIHATGVVAVVDATLFR